MANASCQKSRATRFPCSQSSQHKSWISRKNWPSEEQDFSSYPTTRNGGWSTINQLDGSWTNITDVWLTKRTLVCSLIYVARQARRLQILLPLCCLGIRFAALFRV